MSSCRHGGRDVYAAPHVTEYDRVPPIRGRIVYEDGTDSKFTFSRMTDSSERKVREVEIDGETYAKERTCEIKELDALTQTLSMANCYAWGECSACGYITPADSCYCVNCGAKVTNG